MGLRRWNVRADEIRTALGLSDVLHLELHHDGSSSLTANVEAWLEREPAESSAVPTRMVEAAIADGVAVATAHARRLGYNGGIDVQTTLVSVFLSKPMVAFDNALAAQDAKGQGLSGEAARSGASFPSRLRCRPPPRSLLCGARCGNLRSTSFTSSAWREPRCYDQSCRSAISVLW